MTEIEKILSQSETEKENILKSLLDSVGITEKELFKNLESVILKFSSKNGKIVYDENVQKLLLRLNKTITNTLSRSGYNNSVKRFVKDFDKINTNVEKIQKSANGLKIDMRKLSGIQKVEMQNTVDRLIKSGVDSYFAQPLKQALYRHITTGGSISDARKIISSFTVSTDEAQSKLMRYVSQVSTDSVSQYEGALNERIAKEYGLTDIMYVGSIIKDSRPQCRRWTKMERISGEDLKKEIEWANKYGSGMIKDTSPETFMIYRGGYNCRHTAIPVLKK